MLVSQVLTAKGEAVFTTTPLETLEAAASKMFARNIGSLVVTEAEQVVGLISERDVVRAVAQHGEPGLRGPVSAFMTPDVQVAAPSDTVDAILARMTDRRIRHLPVCEAGRLLGLVSIGDLVKARIAETTAEAESLRAYIAS
jgi:CBS domain-containing protein